MMPSHRADRIASKKYFGVSFDPETDMWVAALLDKTLGESTDEAEAARIYDQHARRDEPNLNFPDQEDDY